MSENRITQKDISQEDFENTLRYSYNNHEGSISVNGFLVGLVGRKVTVTAGSTTDSFAFTENGTPLYTILITYTDNTKATLLSAERTA